MRKSYLPLSILLSILFALLLLVANFAHAQSPAPTQSRLIIAHELYWLRTPDDFELYHSTAKNRTIFDWRWPDAGFETSRIPAYVPNGWSAQQMHGFGLIDTNHTPDSLQTATQNSLDASDPEARVFFFPEAQDYLQGAKPEWINAIRQGAKASRRGAKLVLFGCFQPNQKPTNTPKYVADNLDRIAMLPFDGLSVWLRYANETYDVSVTRYLFSTKEVKQADIKKLLAPLPDSRFEYWIEVPCFLGPQVTDEAGKKTLITNLKRLAAEIRAKQKQGVNIVGVLMDTENYLAEKGWMAYSDADLDLTQQQAIELGQQVANALPDLKIMTTVSPIYAMSPGHPYGKNYELLGPFMVGLSSGQ